MTSMNSGIEVESMVMYLWALNMGRSFKDIHSERCIKDEKLSRSMHRCFCISIVESRKVTCTKDYHVTKVVCITVVSSQQC